MILAKFADLIVYSSMSARPTMVSLLADLALGEGVRPSSLPGVRLMYSSENWPRVPVTYDPGIVIIAQGRKRGHLGGQTFLYDPDNYLVLSVPLPFECDTEGTPNKPMLGLFVGVNPSVVAELVMEMRNLPPITDFQGPAVKSQPLDSELKEAALRLLLALRNDDDTRILGPQIVREIVYLGLLRDRSGNLRALATPHSHFGQINRALQRMHVDFAKPIDVPALAREAGMSASTFHNHFKAITSSAPLQYLKSIRLQKARMLMAHEGMTASVASREVGYESASQFSREFKRYFGDTPAAVAGRMRESMVRL